MAIKSLADPIEKVLRFSIQPSILEPCIPLLVQHNDQSLKIVTIFESIYRSRYFVILAFLVESRNSTLQMLLLDVKLQPFRSSQLQFQIGLRYT